MNIKEKRESLGLTQQEVAEMCGISLSSYQKYESGVNKIENAKYSVVLALARTLQVYSQELLSEQYTYGDSKKRTLECLVNTLLKKKEKSINSKGNLIDQKRNIAKKIFNKLVGVEGLGEIKTHERVRGVNFSYVECFIPITDYKIMIKVTIATEEISVSAKYLGDDMETYEKKLLKYNSSFADSMIDIPSDYEIDQLTEFMVLKITEYIGYLKEEKKIEFKDICCNIWSNSKIYGDN
ncbi:transcriptional regulator with XRE-family HTH domain [Clostridium beijerinckii]|uniref:helix-turn-helix domain-containing protein n=1 Tax=Clostridium beijerinckii TaxID=1520 RepID=UPI001494E1B3|nr:helix-turn-helix transcriptional regulator [Clostridium beijerinckii]NOW92349.1 transcriptional regulator with XRE-family HTH domain [Clostridium beijerinckii]